MSKVRVTGLKKFKGEIEGTHYDTTTLFVDMRMDSSKGNQIGRASVEMKWKSSTLFDQLAPLLDAAEKANKPFYCEIEREEVSIGKGQSRMELVSVQPIALQADANKPAGA